MYDAALYTGQYQTNLDLVDYISIIYLVVCNVHRFQFIKQTKPSLALRIAVRGHRNEDNNNQNRQTMLQSSPSPSQVQSRSSPSLVIVQLQSSYSLDLVQSQSSPSLVLIKMQAQIQMAVLCRCRRTSLSLSHSMIFICLL